MSEPVSTLDRIVTALVPSLSKSLAEQFNVFRVMRHGTHEKQLSNVFAWLLDAQATHQLGDAVQRIFLECVNARLSPDQQVPPTGYRVTQEVNTSGEPDSSRDIADIVLSNDVASVVVENFESSDGHEHDYGKYLAHGQAGGRRSVVVLLCGRHEPHRQQGGWEKAVVVTYAQLLEKLGAHIAHDRAWRTQHEKQRFFIGQLIDHFVEGPVVASREDRIEFIKAMCETGESARYGYRPQQVAAEEFANQVAQHARHQFEAGREMLHEAKSALQRYAEHTLKAQVNEALDRVAIAVTQAKFQGKWEWYVYLTPPPGSPSLPDLVFGPTAATANDAVPSPLADPDYTKVFVLTTTATEACERLDQTEVGIAEVLAGLSADDMRLRDAVIAAIGRIQQ